MISLLFFLSPTKKKGRGEKKQNMPPTEQIDIRRELLAITVQDYNLMYATTPLAKPARGEGYENAGGPRS
jgi:hypothetical protein